MGGVADLRCRRVLSSSCCSRCLSASNSSPNLCRFPSTHSSKSCADTAAHPSGACVSGAAREASQRPAQQPRNLLQGGEWRVADLELLVPLLLQLGRVVEECLLELGWNLLSLTVQVWSYLTGIHTNQTDFKNRSGLCGAPSDKNTPAP